MAASFVAASSQRITAPTLITAAPFTVGCWYWLDSDSTFQVWSITDNTVTNNWFSLQKAANTMTFHIGDSGGATQVTTGTASDVAGAWMFAICREISSTNHRIAIIRGNRGDAIHGSNTDSRTPTGLNTMAVGCRELSTPDGFLSGRVAEFWYTNTDIQPDGAQLQASLLRQLAYGGPFSVPHIAKDIIEYRSFRKHPTAGELGEVYWGKYGVQNWTNTNGVTIGPHVPLSAWYNRPPQTQIIRPPQNLLRSGIWSQAAPVAEVTMFDGFYPSMVDRSIKIIPY